MDCYTGAATSDQRPATSNQQPATSDQQPATSNQQPATSIAAVETGGPSLNPCQGPTAIDTVMDASVFQVFPLRARGTRTHRRVTSAAGAKPRVGERKVAQRDIQLRVRTGRTGDALQRAKCQHASIIVSKFRRPCWALRTLKVYNSGFSGFQIGNLEGRAFFSFSGF